MRKLEQYRIHEGKTPLSGPELSQRFFDIDGRLHQIELLKISWEQAVAEVQNHGLERINGVIQPLLDQANDILGLIQQEFDSVKTEWDQTSDTIAQEWQAILDVWSGVQGTLDAMQDDIDGAQAAAQSYTDRKTLFAKHQIEEWSPADNHHPYNNLENSSIRGKTTIRLAADAESWLLGTFTAQKSNANINTVFRYMMSTADTDPVNWGIAVAVGNQDLCAVPRQDSTIYTIGDRVCANPPDGCTYEMIEGAAGFGATDLCTGGTALSSDDFSGYPASNAFDDNVGTRWAPSTSGLGDQPYLGYDLGSGNAKEIGKLRIYQYESEGNAITAGNIQYSDDGSTWYTAAALTFSTYGVWEEKVFFGAGSHRYWRLSATAGILSDHTWSVYELELYELLGSTGTSAAAQPTMNQALNGETTDNEIKWKCVSTDNYDTISLTGETVPTAAWTESTKQFTITDAGITAGDIVRVLAIRKVDPPSNYWAQQNLSAATVTAVAATVPYGTSTIAGMYDGVKGNTDYNDPSNCTFASAYLGSMVGNYAQIVFGSAKTIARITINQPVNNQYTSSIKIQYHNGSAWVDLETFTAALGDTVMELASPASATQYRVTCNADMYQWGSGYRYWTIGELVFETYETAPGTTHDGDLHLINATHQAVEA